jgi:predicted nucleotidyltransferase
MKHFKTNVVEIDEQIDAFIEFTKDILELNIVSIYLLGSYIDSSFVENSDIDIAIVYKNADINYIKKIERFFLIFSRNFFKREIDLYLISTDEIKQLDQKALLTREGIVNIKLASRLLYGKDIKKDIKLDNFDDYIDLTLDVPFHFMKKIRGLKNDLIVGSKNNLTYPNKKDYYFGYTSFIRNTHNKVESKPILSLIGWMCTGMIAIKGRRRVGKKSDVSRMYKKYVNDEWTPFVEKAYKLIREVLQYELPANKQNGKELRSLCLNLIKFEQHFMQEYENYSKKTKLKIR